MQSVILAGGKGTRLAARLNGRPKPLIEIAGVPLLERQLRQLQAAGVSEAIVLVNHEAHQIEAFLAERDWGALAIELIDDGEPRGTAGAVLAGLDRLRDTFLVLYGDTLFDIFTQRRAIRRGLPPLDASNAEAEFKRAPPDAPEEPLRRPYAAED